MKIAVIGTGYVGSVTGICFAYKGYQVMGVDIDAAKVERLQKGQITIYEPELDNLLAQCLKNNKISFTTDLEQAVDFADIIFLALPTPPTEDGSADLKYVLQAARQIAEHMKSYKLIVNKSTVPVDTAQKVANLIASITKQPFDVASNPEFLREGAAVEDFMQPDRVVIGTDTSKAANLLKTLYAPFVKNAETDILCMDIRSAELTKYAANAYLATRISFMNEMANLCLIVGANIDWVRLGIGMDTRIGPKFLFPGIGYGGSCFPKDVLALSETANQNNYNFRILEAVMNVNAAQRQDFAQKVITHFNHQLQGIKLAVWGLAFKPNTDDIREAPAIDIIETLLQAGAAITAYDPQAIENIKQQTNLKNSISFASNAIAALDKAHALLILTKWDDFKQIPIETIAKHLLTKTIFDGRNVFNPQDMQQHSFFYYSIGRQTVQ